MWSRFLTVFISVITGAVGFLIGRQRSATNAASSTTQPCAPPANPSPDRESDAPTTRTVSAFDANAAGAQHGVKAKILGFGKRRRWRWFGRVMQIQQRFGELQGGNIASAVALQTFLSLFPMLLVALAILGFVVHNQGDQMISDIIARSGLTGDAATTLKESLSKAAGNRKTTSVVGFLTLVWSAIGVSSALQYALNQTWQASPRGFKDKFIGALWLAGASLLFVTTMAVTTLMTWLPAAADVVAIIVGMAVSFALWMFTMKVLPNVNVSWKALMPGAVVGVIGIEILKILGAVWVPKAVESSSGLYGTVGVVFAVLAWVILFGKLVVYASVVNVVLSEGKHGVERQTIEVPKPASATGSDMTRAGTVVSD